jgi:glycosyltransferase involved in cell wall biosynthesis
VDLGIEDKVFFAGHVDEVEKVLGWLDIFALSSDTEQMPNSLIQAMAAGRPVVAVDVGDVKEIVAPENRPFVVPRDDARQFRGGLERLLGDASERARLGRLNQARVREYFTEERMFNAYEDVLMDRS